MLPSAVGMSSQERQEVVPGLVELEVAVPVGAENSVTSCDLQILVYQATEAVSS